MHFGIMAQGFYKSCRILPIRDWLAMWLCISVISSACSMSTQSSGASTSTENQSDTGSTHAVVSAPAPSVPAAIGVPANPYGPPTLDELIFFSDVIAIVRLVSVDSDILTIRNVQGQEVYSPVTKTRFEVVEYLKGDGHSEIVADAYDFHATVPSTEHAIKAAEISRDAHLASLDGDLFLVFLQHTQYPDTILKTTLKTDETGLRQRNNPIGLFSVSGGIGAASTTFHKVSEADAEIEQFEPLSLDDLLGRIAAIETLQREGEGVKGFDECIKSKFLHENYRRKYKDSLTSVADVATFHSGMPANFVVHEFSTTYPRQWFSGDNAPLFHYGAKQITTTRPLPAGSYEVSTQYQKSEWIPCGYESPSSIWRYTFEANEGVLHEAFFDPAAIGDAVGADGAKGVLKPSSFTVEGTGSVSVERIEWESDSVELELAPHEGMSAHHIDFIALDGTVALRLDFDDAVETGEGSDRALSWRVCEQPWSAGDLLMLRISASPADLSGVYDASSCVLAPTATPTPEPTQTPTPAPTATPELTATPDPLATATPVSTPTPVSTTQ